MPDGEPEVSAPIAPPVYGGGSGSPVRVAKASKWRGYNRAIHRDLGHLAVGLTIVYALSGIAVNHIADWDPSFREHTKVVELGGPVKGEDDEAKAREVLKRLGETAAPREVYRASPTALEIVFDKRTIHVDDTTGHVVDEGQSPRFFLRIANWLHLNRGKKAWTYVADAYAGGLLLLALTGIVMMPGRKGLLGRGGLLIVLGAAIPFVYVQASGGPHKASPPAAQPLPK